MAKQRMIQTKFWSDPFVQDMSAEGKLLFLYLLTNEHTNIAGFYEVSLRTIEFESGLSKTHLTQALDRLSQSGRVYYFDGWIYIKNFIRHQKMNPSIQKGIEAAMSVIPNEIKEKAQAVDRLGTDCDNLVHFNINLNSNLNLNSNKKKGSAKASRVSKGFVKPTEDDVAKYCEEKDYGINPVAFINHYESNGWRVGKTAMKDWRAAVRTWEGRRKEQSYNEGGSTWKKLADE